MSGHSKWHSIKHAMGAAANAMGVAGLVPCVGTFFVFHGVDQFPAGNESRTDDNAVRWPIWRAPEPSRIVEVSAAVSPRSTAGEVPATPGLR